MTLLFFFAKFTIPYMKQKSVLAKGEIMRERVTAEDLRHVETKIIMTEVLCSNRYHWISLA